MQAVAIVGVIVALFVWVLVVAIRDSYRSPVQPEAVEAALPRLLPPAADELDDPARQLHDRIGADELAQALTWLDGPDADDWIARGLSA